jgi:nucleoid-associated protein YgaU
MLSAAQGLRWADLGLLSLALAAAVGGTLAQDAGVTNGQGVAAPVVGRELGMDLEVQVEQLTQRIQGMEGKLRESAAARKTADQARMEAERRLAEGAQELGRLRAEVSLLQDAIGALELRLRRAEERAEVSARGLLAAEESVRRLTAERDARAAEQAVSERQGGQLLELQQPIAEASREHVWVQAQEQSDLRRALSERESDLKRVQLELRAARAERDALSRRLDALRVTSPDLEGGDLSLGEAQDRVATAAAALREALTRVPGRRDLGTRRAVWEAAQDLHRHQLQVARLLGARSVYRVGPGDSLVLIAGRFYGDGSRWEEIQEANLRVVPDPSHLMPGLSLVIP